MRSTRSDRQRSAPLDILHNIALAESFVGGQTFESFRDDLLRVYAVTRCLEIISKASRRLTGALKQRHPAIAWRHMAGAGSVYRHYYDHVAARRLWDTVHVALPPLLAVVEQELSDA